MKLFRCHYENSNELIEIFAHDEEDAACKMAQNNPSGWGTFPFAIMVWVDDVKYEVEPEIDIHWNAKKC